MNEDKIPAVNRTADPKPVSGGTVEKCRWYNDAQSAVALMIDDLSCGFLNHYGSGFDARCDWGYGCREKDSIFAYFEKSFLERFPEARYTVFLPFGKHAIAQPATGYSRDSGGIFENESFGKLVGYIAATGNEIAYHGHNHGDLDATLEPATWSGEFARYGEGEYVEVMRKDLERIREAWGIRVSGGKFPGYRYDAPLEKGIGTLGLKWWVFDFNPDAKSHGYRQGLVDLPANMAGNMFNRSGRPFRDLIRDLIREKRLVDSIKDGRLISIQEHFLSTRPDGRRQTPNVFDDIFSLEKTFALLRGFDLWYATGSQIAGHLRARDESRLTLSGDKGFSLGFDPSSAGDMGVTLKCGARRIRRSGKEDWILGGFKRGAWVYNDVTAGEYVFG